MNLILNMFINFGLANITIYVHVSLCMMNTVFLLMQFRVLKLLQGQQCLQTLWLILDYIDSIQIGVTENIVPSQIANFI